MKAKTKTENTFVALAKEFQDVVLEKIKPRNVLDALMKNYLDLFPPNLAELAVELGAKLIDEGIYGLAWF